MFLGKKSRTEAETGHIFSAKVDSIYLEKYWSRGVYNTFDNIAIALLKDLLRVDNISINAEIDWYFTTEIDDEGEKIADFVPHGWIDGHLLVDDPSLQKKKPIKFLNGLGAIMKKRFDRPKMPLLPQTRNLQSFYDRDKNILIVQHLILWLSWLPVDKLYVHILIFLVPEIGFKILMRTIIIINLCIT